MAQIGRIEGYVIVSADGMIADRDGLMPPELIVPADQAFFERGLDNVDIVLHGRLSQESHPRSAERRRIIVTRSVIGLSADGGNAKIVFWNPAGAPLTDAVLRFHIAKPTVGVVGGSEVFGLFLPLYDVFYLSRAPDVRIPGGRSVFPGVPRATPEEMLATHGMHMVERTVLDPARNVDLTTWRRAV